RAGKTVPGYSEADTRSDEGLAATKDSLILGNSVPTMRLHSEIALVARLALPVLVLGETGVGKELVAEDIHRRSRRPGAFVAVNCAAIAPELAESEPFGHLARPFTRAHRPAHRPVAAADP